MDYLTFARHEWPAMGGEPFDRSPLRVIDG